MRIILANDDKEYGYSASLEDCMRIEELWTKILAMIRDECKIIFEHNIPLKT